jgi:hypothetical protein
MLLMDIRHVTIDGRSARCNRCLLFDTVQTERKRMYTNISEQGGIGIHVCVLFVEPDSTCLSPRRYGVRRASRNLFICANSRALKLQHPGCLWTLLISLSKETVQSVLQCFISYEGSIATRSFNDQSRATSSEFNFYDKANWVVNDIPITSITN